MVKYKKKISDVTGKKLPNILDLLRRIDQYNKKIEIAEKQLQEHKETLWNQ